MYGNDVRLGFCYIFLLTISFLFWARSPQDAILRFVFVVLTSINNKPLAQELTLQGVTRTRLNLRLLRVHQLALEIRCENAASCII